MSDKAHTAAAMPLILISLYMVDKNPNNCRCSEEALMGQQQTKDKLVVVVPPRRARFCRTRQPEPLPKGKKVEAEANASVRQAS